MNGVGREEVEDEFVVQQKQVIENLERTQKVRCDTLRANKEALIIAKKVLEDYKKVSSSRIAMHYQITFLSETYLRTFVS